MPQTKATIKTAILMVAVTWHARRLLHIVCHVLTHIDKTVIKLLVRGRDLK